MAISGLSGATTAHTVSGVRAANEQVRAFGAGLSSLLEVAERIADRVPAVPAASGRGQTVDIAV